MFYSQIASFRQPHSVTSRRDQFSISDLTAATKYRPAAGRKVCTIAQQVTHLPSRPPAACAITRTEDPDLRRTIVKNGAGQFRGVFLYSDSPRIDLYILEIPERRNVDDFMT